MNDIRIGDFVYIDERVIEKKVLDLRQQNKNKAADRWKSYAHATFRVNGFTIDNLVIIMDGQGNEITISKKALHLDRT